jgi:hypothetical protein
VAGLSAVVAAPSRPGAAQTEGGAVSLDMSKALAVVALLSLGGARQRAFARLVVYSRVNGPLLREFQERASYLAACLIFRVSNNSNE